MKIILPIETCGCYPVCKFKNDDACINGCDWYLEIEKRSDEEIKEFMKLKQNEVRNDNNT